MKSIRKKDFSNYWSKTSSYEVISDRIRQNFEGTKEDVVQMLSGESVDVNVTRYLNTMTSFGTRGDLFTYLIHLVHIPVGCFLSAYTMTKTQRPIHARLKSL